MINIFYSVYFQIGSSRFVLKRVLENCCKRHCSVTSPIWRYTFLWFVFHWTCLINLWIPSSVCGLKDQPTTTMCRKYQHCELRADVSSVFSLRKPEAVCANVNTHPQLAPRPIHAWAAHPSGPGRSAKSHPPHQVEPYLIFWWLSIECAKDSRIIHTVMSCGLFQEIWQIYLDPDVNSK